MSANILPPNCIECPDCRNGLGEPTGYVRCQHWNEDMSGDEPKRCPTCRGRGYVIDCQPPGVGIVTTEGRAPAASEPAQPRTEGTRGYVGECAAGVTEDETIIEASRLERIEDMKQSGKLLYKCRLCGEIDDSLHCPNVDQAVIEIALYGEARNTMGIIPTMITTHAACKLGIGIADCIGGIHDPDDSD